MIYSLMKNWKNLSYKERYDKATHYYTTDTDPHNSLLGFVDEWNNFVSVLISIHKQKAKKDFIKYDAFNMKTQPNTCFKLKKKRKQL